LKRLYYFIDEANNIAYMKECENAKEACEYRNENLPNHVVAIKVNED